MQQFHHGQAIVLVVEDEVLVRSCVACDLEDAGFGVIEAANAADALRQFNEDDRISIVFTDINMPGPFDGLSLAHKIVLLRPTVQMILTSGRGRPDTGEVPIGSRFLPKPYDSRSLIEMIKAA